MIILAISVFHLDLVRLYVTVHICTQCSGILKYEIFHVLQQLKHIDSNLAIALMGMYAGISNLFISCFFGKLATESYSKMTDYLLDTNWYEYPSNLQKYLVVMVANTQRPIVYHGFKIVILDLGSFTKANLKILQLKRALECSRVKYLIPCFPDDQIYVHLLYDVQGNHILNRNLDSTVTTAANHALMLAYSSDNSRISGSLQFSQNQIIFVELTVRSLVMCGATHLAVIFTIHFARSIQSCAIDSPTVKRNANKRSMLFATVYVKSNVNQ